jgi:hypothetical protein
LNHDMKSFCFISDNLTHALSMKSWSKL